MNYSDVVTVILYADPTELWIADRWLARIEAADIAARRAALRALVMGVRS